jgi:predicted Zn-dependent peptidase
MAVCYTRFMKIKQQKIVLKNGLTLIVAPMATESVGLILSVRVGSRDESTATNGISHFMEHMVFKGTERWPKPTDMNQVIEGVGGVVNAFTNFENTSFWVKVAKKYLGLGLEFLHQAVFHPLIPVKELEKERGVIVEEINRYEDLPDQKVSDDFVVQTYKGTNLGRRIIGSKKNILSLQRDDFCQHLHYWYQPANMVLAVAGGVNPEQVVKQAEKIFEEKTESKSSFKDKPKPVSLSQRQAQLRLIKRKTQQAHFCLGLTTIKRDDPDRYSLGVLNIVLGGNMSSRLFNEVREKRGLVYSIKSETEGFFETGYLVVQAGCDLNRTEEAIKVTKNEFFKLAEKAKTVTESELRRTKEYLKGVLALRLEDSFSVASLFGHDLLLDNRLRSIEEIKQGCEAVTIADVWRLAKKIFVPERLNLTVLGPFASQANFEGLLKG